MTIGGNNRRPFSKKGRGGFNFSPFTGKIRRFKTLAAFFIIFSVFAGALLISAIFGYVYVQGEINSPFSAVSRDVSFVVKKGEGARDIAENLEKQKLISGKFYFEFYVWENGLEKEMRAGEYLLSPSLSVSEIARILVSGQVVSSEIEVTIPEGFTEKNIAERLESAGLLGEKEFSRQAEILFPKFAAEYDFLDAVSPDYPFEGFLFPDTYKFAKKSSAEEIIGKFLKNFDEKLDENLRAEISRQNKTIAQIVVMASIIEKEVRTEEDMRLVSGVLWKRFETGMPLQVDAAIAYATGKKTGEITYDDLRIVSPYNTYRNKGLPPYPISNPGMRAILAAVYPTESDFWYYLSKPDGETVFSRNFSEHQKAKNAYLK